MLFCVMARETSAQQTRPMEIRLDTLELPLCGSSRTFLMPVWIGDVPVSDSLYDATVVISWDRTTLDLEDLVLVSSSTLGSRFTEQPSVTKAAGDGILYIELGTDPQGRPVSGSNMPLFYLKGVVTTTDTVAGQQGWIEVVSASFTSNVRYEPLTRWPGLVHVVRDTSAANTGRLTIKPVAFDTMRLDTVTLTIDNVAARRIRQLSFRVEVDTAYLEIVDTLEEGTLASREYWTDRTLQMEPGSLDLTLTSGSVLNESGPLLRLILRRRSDSAFTSDVDITRFTVDSGSCIGGLLRQGASVTAGAIRTDTSTVGVDPSEGLEADVRVELATSSSMEVRLGRLRPEWVRLTDLMGREITVRPEAVDSDAQLLHLRYERLPAGRYFLVLGNRKHVVFKHVTLLK